MYTEAIEDYLKVIYELQHEQGKVATTALADRLGVVPASVTGMIKKLAEMGLVVHQPYYGVVLTENGRKIALEIIRHHRLVELYLVEKLGVPWDQAHAQAEIWEHSLSEYLEDRIDHILNYPTTDPHGAPIPTRQGDIAQPEYTPLGDLEVGQPAIIAEVSDHDPALLRYLGGLGLYPGVAIKVIARTPFDNLLTLKVEETECVLGDQVSKYIFVTRNNRAAQE